MNDVITRLIVQVFHTVGDLSGVLNEDVRVQAGLTLLEQLIQCSAVGVLHHEVKIFRGHRWTDAEQLNDIRMLQIREQPCFA